MSDKMPAAIKTVTLNTATYTNMPFNPTFINFFYGKNGSGKTSISRQIKDNEGITWQDDESPSSYDVLVYNQDFIDDRFKTLDKINGVFTLSEGEEDEKAKQEIETLESRQKELQKRQIAISGDKGERNQISSKLHDAEMLYQKACLGSTKDLREKFPNAIKGFSRNPQLSQKINTTTPSECDEAKLKKLYDTAFDDSIKSYPVLTELDGNEHIAGLPECPLLAEEITSSGTTQFASFVKRIQALDWIDAGHKRFHEAADGYCPYCQRKLDDNFETDLASCFDAEYQAAVEKLKSYRDRYYKHMGGICTIIKKDLSEECLPENADRFKSIEIQLETITRIVQSNLSIIDDKISNPGKIVEIEDLTGKLLDINYTIVDCNNRISENNKIFSSLKRNRTDCINSVWGLFAFRMQEEVQDFRQAQADAKDANDTLDEEEKNISKEINDIAARLAVLNTASVTIQTAIDGINRLLHDSGFEGFEIIKSDATKDAYQVVRTKNHKVAVRLSDGERHFLSFLYFYNQVKGCDSSGNRKDKIVVIDDPVSSLDGNALFIISSLTRELVEICYNNTDYRGHQVSGDYIKQIFVLTHNAQFHRSITYNQIGRYRSVNFYKIDKFDNKSTVTLCTRPSETEAGEEENFNPVKNAYAALWVEYRSLHNEIALMNVIHRILDYYFLDICGNDGMSIRELILRDERDKFIDKKDDGTPDLMPLHLADSMLQYMSAGVEGDMNYISDGASEEQIKNTFRLIFERLGQGAHYDMMMERSR